MEVGKELKPGKPTTQKAPSGIEIQFQRVACAFLRVEEELLVRHPAAAVVRGQVDLVAIGRG
jgi:hypothetical protein